MNLFPLLNAGTGDGAAHGPVIDLTATAESVVDAPEALDERTLDDKLKAAYLVWAKTRLDGKPDDSSDQATQDLTRIIAEIIVGDLHDGDYTDYEIEGQMEAARDVIAESRILSRLTALQGPGTYEEKVEADVQVALAEINGEIENVVDRLKQEQQAALSYGQDQGGPAPLV